MAEQTGISWCHSTWSPWRGCVKVSPGCDHCYAEAMSHRNPAVLGEWGPEGKRVLNADWRKPLAWDRAAAKAGERRRVFPSLCDPFEEFSGRVVDVKGNLCHGSDFPGNSSLDVMGLDDIREQFFGMIHSTPNLDWLVLTKRPQNIAAMMADYREAWHGLTLPNLWMGTSVEDQQRADERIPHLLATPAAIRWLSVEPLLGPIDLSPYLEPAFVAMADPDAPGFDVPAVDWVVIGGESGPLARPCDIGWIRAIVAQCKAAGVPVYVKQLGARPNGLPGDPGWGGPGGASGSRRLKLRDPKGGDIGEFPKDLRIREFPVVG